MPGTVFEHFCMQIQFKPQDKPQRFKFLSSCKILIWKLREVSDLLKVTELLMESPISKRLLFLL